MNESVENKTLVLVCQCKSDTFYILLDGEARCAMCDRELYQDGKAKIGVRKTGLSVASTNN